MPTQTTSTDTAADLVVIGAGIVGLAHAAEGLARGLRVHLIERDER
ncbi:FAD-dependent oxidoreductase, partial [Nocardioides sp. NPDC057772]